MADETKDKADALDGVQEPPTLEGVEGEGEPQEGNQIQGADELLQMLEAHGIQSPDDFSGLVNELTQYKKNYGQSQNEVGELRRMVASLQEQIQSVNRQSGVDDFGESQPVDLKNEIKSVLREFWDEQQRIQTEAQQRYFEERMAIESRPNWKNVQPYFDKALQNPQIQQALQSGRLTMESLYSRLNERILLASVDNFVKQIPKDAKIGSVTGTETSDRVPQPPPPNLQREQAIKKAKEKGDVDGLLKSLIPDNDPIVRY